MSKQWVSLPSRCCPNPHIAEYSVTDMLDMCMLEGQGFVPTSTCLPFGLVLGERRARQAVAMRATVRHPYARCLTCRPA